jgi:hypothetical protein
MSDAIAEFFVVNRLLYRNVNGILSRFDLMLPVPRQAASGGVK